jgi:PAS domain S-box-containing protein
MKTKLEIKEEKHRILIMAILLAICCLITYYFHRVLEGGTVFTHFFYIPIILASLWWRRKGLAVAIFLGVWLILSHFFIRTGADTMNDLLRAPMFIVVSLVTAYLSEKIWKAKEEIEKEKNFSENIITTVPDSLIVVDKDLRIKRVNLSFNKVFGLRPEKAIGIRIVDLLGDNKGKLITELTRLLGTKTVLENFELHYHSEKLGHRIFNIAARGIIVAENGEEEQKEVLIVIGDISERKRAEEELKKYREHLEELVEERTVELRMINERLQKEIEEHKRAEEAVKKERNFSKNIIATVPDSLLVLNKDLEIKSANRTFYERFQIKSERVIGACITDILGDGGGRLSVELSRLFGTDDMLENFELRYQTENIGLSHEAQRLTTRGERILDITARGIIIAEEEEEEEELLVVLQDITERKQAEEELRKSEEKIHLANERLQHLLYSSPTIIYSCKTSGDYGITFISENVFKITGYLSENFIKDQKFWIDHIHPEDREYVLEKKAAILKKEYSAFEYRFRKKDGIYIWLRDNKKLIKDINGVPVEIVGSILNVTEQKQAEEALRESEEQLRQSQKMESIGNLAGGIAHDFNNLLTIISGYSQLLSDRLDKNAPLRKNAEKIMKAGKQAASLTRQLLAFSRKQVLEMKVLNLNEIIANEQKMLKRLIGEDIKMEADLAPNLNPVKVDSGQVEQVAMNLVVNARDAMPEGGRITIKTENVTLDKDVCKTIPESSPGEFVRVLVEDTGVGMKKEIIDKIFEPFFTTKKTGKGTGLGLSVVYGIVKQHDGWINVYSEPGQGTTFKIYLPAVSAEIEDETKGTISLKDIKGSGERILLVEDEDGIREFATNVLRENGYIIFEAANSKEAFDIFMNEDANFDLIFSDVVMPGKSGLQLVDELLSARPELQVLLCSGYSDKKSQWDEIKKRGFRFLQKPYNVVDLLKRIREVLEQK